MVGKMNGDGVQEDCGIWVGIGEVRVGWLFKEILGRVYRGSRSCLLGFCWEGIMSF